MEIYFIRHCESIANQKGIIASQSQSPLSEEGINQAKWLKNKLPERDVIYSSSLKRAIQSGMLSCELESEDDIIKSPLLNERDWGKFLGKTYDEVRIMENKHPRHTLQLMFKIESEETFLNRIQQSLTFIVNHMTRNNHQSALVFSHGGVMRRLKRLIDPDAEKPPMENMDFIHIQYRKNKIVNITQTFMYQLYLTETGRAENMNKF